MTHPKSALGVWEAGFQGLAVTALFDEAALRMPDTVGDHLSEYRGVGTAMLTGYQLRAHACDIPGRVRFHREHPTRASPLRPRVSPQ
ncbi:hypothetical protein [Streptomyces shenzhenensis]|uniref:Uncharacterized protein n=1 Tax=Streptomyces shenzhenensis TaxID=943815 RepID=A0A3M0IET0_9ACTN|nr:hypothetical protein [Streptomyces shenzhenensis]RMB80356.1 hypothetical protein CTZ28_40270 [Streptomyces shenzhenensis]